MKLQIFSVYDDKAAVFGTPIFLPHKGIAVREFSDIALDKSSSIDKQLQLQSKKQSQQQNLTT